MSENKIYNKNTNSNTNKCKTKYRHNTEYDKTLTTYPKAVDLFNEGKTVFLYPDNELNIPVCVFNKIGARKDIATFENWNGVWAVLNEDRFDKLPRRHKKNDKKKAW